MDKLVERETATRNPLVAAPALAVQFFLIPLAVVGVTVLVYLGFRSLLTDDRSPQDYLTEIQTGGHDRRWPAAYELSRLMADPAVRADRALGAGARRRRSSAPRTTIRGCGGIWRWRIGRLDPPLPARRGRRSDERRSSDADGEARISAIWALGSSGDPTVVPTLQPLYESPDAGIRKMVVYALGALPGDAQLARCGRRCRIGARRPVERGGRAGAARQPRRRAGAAADARSRSTSSRPSSATSRPDADQRSGRGRHDQRAARGRGAEGRRRCARRSKS